MYSTTYDGEFVNEVPSSEADLEKTFRAVKACYRDKDIRIKYLEQKVKELEDEKWKDNELQNMKKEYEAMKDDYYRGFPISKKEKDAIYKWKENHLINQHGLTTPVERALSGGAIGGSFKFEFIPTSIGTIGTCICGSCRNRARKDAKGNGELFQKLIKEYDAEFIFQNI